MQVTKLLRRAWLEKARPRLIQFGVLPRPRFYMVAHNAYYVSNRLYWRGTAQRTRWPAGHVRQMLTTEIIQPTAPREAAEDPLERLGYRR